MIRDPPRHGNEGEGRLLGRQGNRHCYTAASEHDPTAGGGTRPAPAVGCGREYGKRKLDDAIGRVGVLIMFAVLHRLDPSFEEVARDQGASSWQTLRHVVIPMVAPGLVGVALFGFTLSYDEFARTSMVSGAYNTLPAELVAVTTNNASLALYAVGTLTTTFSFVVIAAAFLVFAVIQRQRTGMAHTNAEVVAVSGPWHQEQ